MRGRGDPARGPAHRARTALGIGKPNPVANEFYRRAARDPGIDLTIITALSLRKPTARTGLEKRLLGPIVERVFGNYVELEYAQALRRNDVPPNIHIVEFFLEPGAYLGSEHAQQNYLSANYTHVIRDVMARGVNVIAHLVARRTARRPSGDQLRLQSRCDGRPAAARGRGAERGSRLRPHRTGASADAVHDGTGDARPGALRLPHRRRALRLHAVLPAQPADRQRRSCDRPARELAGARWRTPCRWALASWGMRSCNALLLRHQQGGVYADALRSIGTERFGALVDAIGGRQAVHERSVRVDRDVHRSAARPVSGRRAQPPRMRPACRSSDCWRLAPSPVRVEEKILEALVKVGVGPKLTADEFRELKHFGVFRRDVEFSAGRMRAEDGSWVTADLADPVARARDRRRVSRSRAAKRSGAARRILPRPARVLRSVARFAGKRSQPDRHARRCLRESALRAQTWSCECSSDAHARFVNTTMMVTLLGRGGVRRAGRWARRERRRRPV